MLLLFGDNEMETSDAAAVCLGITGNRFAQAPTAERPSVLPPVSGVPVMPRYHQFERVKLLESIRHHRDDIRRARIEIDQPVVVTRELIEASRVLLCSADRLLDITDRLFRL